MLKSEVINISSNYANFKFDTSNVIAELENESYLKTDLNELFRKEVKTKIEDFSNWFNSIARLYLLRCDSEESEIFIYLLLNLKKKLKYAISEINRSISNHKQTFTCKICNEKIEIKPWQNIWSTLQNHPHFEELYTQNLDFNDSSNSESFECGEISANNSIMDDLSEDLNQMTLIETKTDTVEPENCLNNFRFNFVITYDQRIKEALYPDPLVVAARKKDNISEYTVQRCGVGRGVCLLCPCTLSSRSRYSKFNTFIIKNHVSGQRHLKYAQAKVNLSALKQYHEFWRGQDPNYQAHQVHFVPEINGINVIRCHLCLVITKYANVIDHIKDKEHKERILKIFNTPGGKLNDFYLLNMQVAVYDVLPDEKKNTISKPKDVKNEKKELNGTPSQKCVIVKFCPEPNTFDVPPRYKDHLQFFKKIGDAVNCKICKTNFDNNWVVIRKHIFNAQHKQMSGLAIPKFNFFCEICNRQIKDEDDWLDHFLKGPNRHDSIPPARKLKVAEYECQTCQMVIYGDDLSINRHQFSRSSKSGHAKEVRLPHSVKKLFRSKQFIEEEASNLQIEALRVLECQDRMKDCCEDLQRAVSEIYPNCRAYPFGSRISGLGNDQSDLDIFIDTGDMYFGEINQDSYKQEQFVKKVSKSLKSFKEDFSSVFPIPSARTPIVKLHHNYTKLDCDISFRHGLGVENTKFLRFCIDLQPITQPFILLLKKWSDYCKLNEHITNYGLALMGIFYLQTEGYLLAVKTVRNYNPTQSVVIDGWETLNYTVPIDQMKKFIRPYTGSIKDLLRDFFFYFAKFDYANKVVCPLMGNAVPKLLFNEKPNENLPREMESYIKRIQSDNGEQFRGLTPFCVQDPFDLSHNLTKACQHGTISKLKALSTLTYEFMDSIE